MAHFHILLHLPLDTPGADLARRYDFPRSCIVGSTVDVSHRPRQSADNRFPVDEPVPHAEPIPVVLRLLLLLSRVARISPHRVDNRQQVGITRVAAPVNSKQGRITI